MNEQERNNSPTSSRGKQKTKWSYGKARNTAGGGDPVNPSRSKPHESAQHTNKLRKKNENEKERKRAKKATCRSGEDKKKKK
jgi:hypothetical protein